MKTTYFQSLVLLLLGFLWTIPIKLNAQMQPISYWTCDLPNPSNGIKDSKNVRDLIFGIVPQIKSGGPVGKYVEVGDNHGALTASSNPFPSGSMTVEFLFKPSKKFNNSEMWRDQPGTMSGGIFWTKFGPPDNSVPYIYFTTNTVGQGSHTLYIPLNKRGRGSASWFMDGKFHHIVFRYNHTTGVKDIWLDGQCPTGFSTTITPGALSQLSEKTFFFCSSVPYRQSYMGWDEIAIYNGAIPTGQIYQHYLDFQAGQPYSFTVAGSVPAASDISTGLDTLSFAPNTVLPTTGAVTLCTGPSALTQHKFCPLPRYRHSVTDVPPLFDWADPIYQAGLGQVGGSFTYANVVDTLKKLLVELGRNWNYAMWLSRFVGPNSNLEDTGTNPDGAMLKVANDNPDLPVGYITLRAQINLSGPNTPALGSSNYPPQNYLRNSSGAFIPYGNFTKIWSPLADTANYRADGEYTRQGLIKILAKLPNRPADKKITYIEENGEVIPPIPASVLSQDPAVVAAAAAAGMSVLEFGSKKWSEVCIAYRNQFMNLPGLQKTKYTEYLLNGKNDFTWLWKYTRNVSTPMRNDMHYSTSDMYIRYPYNWRMWVGAWHGYQWFAEGRLDEIAAKDTLFSPHVSAGWDRKEEMNIRPAQYLALLKLMNGLGADFYYVGFFHEGSAPWPLPENWTWQKIIASYAQATWTNYAKIHRNSSIVLGEQSTRYDPPVPGPSLHLVSGDPRIIVIARKHNTLNQYAINSAIIPCTNDTGNVPDVDTAFVRLDNKDIKFLVRPQGSTYVWDNSDPNKPVFYQVDAWHEKTHPWYWDRGFYFEAENYGNTETENQKISTEITPAILAGDYTNFTTYVNTVVPDRGYQYYFKPRSGTGSTEYYVYIRVKNLSDTPQEITLGCNGQNRSTVKVLVNSNTWTWMNTRKNGSRIKFTGISTVNENNLRILGSPSVCIDKLYITTNPNWIPNL